MATSMASVEGPGKWSHFEARGARRLDVTARRRLRFSVVREIPLCDGPLASPSLRCASRLPGVNFSRMPLCVAVVRCEECEASRAWEILAIFSPFSPWDSSRSNKIDRRLTKERSKQRATRKAHWLQLCKEILVFVASCKPGQ